MLSALLIPVVTVSDPMLGMSGGNVFPTLPGLGWDVKKTPVFKTLVQESQSGRECRLALMSYPIWEFELSFSVLRGDSGLAEMQQLAGFFIKQKGQFGAWFYADPDDFTVNNHAIGVGNGTNAQFQLTRSMGGMVEPVMYPNNIVMLVNGYPVAHINETLGVVTLSSPPASGASVAWSGSFYYRCRFKEDSAQFNQFAYKLWELQSLSFRACLGDKL